MLHKAIDFRFIRGVCPVWSFTKKMLWLDRITIVEMHAMET